MSESQQVLQRRPVYLEMSPAQRFVLEQWEGPLSRHQPSIWPISPEALAEMESKVLGILLTFPESIRRVVELRFGFDGAGYKSLAKVAKILEVSPGTLRGRYHQLCHDIYRRSPDIVDYMPLGDDSVAYAVAQLPIIHGDAKLLDGVSLSELSIAEDWVKLVGWENTEYRESVGNFLREEARPYLESLSGKQLEFIGKRLELLLRKARESQPLRRVHPESEDLVEIPLYSNEFLPTVQIPEDLLQEISELNVEWLGLTPRVENLLGRSGIRKIGQILVNNQASIESLVRGDFGPKSMDELVSKITAFLQSRIPS